MKNIRLKVGDKFFTRDGYVVTITGAADEKMHFPLQSNYSQVISSSAFNDPFGYYTNGSTYPERASFKRFITKLDSVFYET